jgi:hypothetical protein
MAANIAKLPELLRWPQNLTLSGGPGGWATGACVCQKSLRKGVLLGDLSSHAIEARTNRIEFAIPSSWGMATGAGFTAGEQ